MISRSSYYFKAGGAYYRKSIDRMPRGFDIVTAPGVSCGPYSLQDRSSTKETVERAEELDSEVVGR